MIEATNDDPQDSDDDDGGRGESTYLTPVQENKLISMAIHREWDIEARDKRWALRTTRRNMKQENGRISNQAVRNLLAMNKQNMDRDNPSPPATATVQVNVGVQVAGVLQDPEYLEWRRAKELEDGHSVDSDPGPVCQDHIGGPLANGKAPGKAGPGTNGHSNGAHP